MDRFFVHKRVVVFVVIGTFAYLVAKVISVDSLPIEENEEFYERDTIVYSEPESTWERQDEKHEALKTSEMDETRVKYDGYGIEESDPLESVSKYLITEYGYVSGINALQQVLEQIDEDGIVNHRSCFVSGIESNCSTYKTLHNKFGVI